MRFQVDIHRSDIKAYWRFIVIFWCLCFFAVPAFSQSRSELETKRIKLLEEIEQTTTQLSKTRKDKAATLDRYITLKRQIEKRQELILTLKKEIAYADTSIVRSQEIISSLERDLSSLKQEYGAMLRMAYRHQRNHSLLTFLFAADSFNDLLKRWQYLRQYEKYRQRQAGLILETRTALTGKVQQLETQKQEKDSLLVGQESQKQLLAQELTDKNTLLNTLKTSERKLASSLESQQEAHDRLNDAIENIIQTEMALKRVEARKPEVLASTPEIAKVVAGDFQKNKGALPWPVKKGTISRNFGTQPHPTIPTITISNNGIDIKTDKQAKVYAVYGGKVVGTQYIPGYQNMIILQHGAYYTVYSNLEKIFVKRGDIIEAQTVIGRVNSDKPEVHFEVWREKQRLNPTAWVARQN